MCATALWETLSSLTPTTFAFLVPPLFFSLHAAVKGSGRVYFDAREIKQTPWPSQNIVREVVYDGLPFNDR